MKKSLLQIIKEELTNFFSDWSMNDEPSIADKYYEKNLGVGSKQPNEQPNTEVFDYVTTQWGKPMKAAIPVYKNPRDLQGIAPYARGILLASGDFYVAQNENAMHDDFLEMLAKHGVIPVGKIYHYFNNFPEEFIAVQRTASMNKFIQSSAYDEFPPHYEAIFDEANKKQPFQFMHLG